MAKKQSNSFAAAALALAISEEELRRRLEAHTKLQTLEVERDRAIAAAYFENERLVRLAANVISVLEPIDEDGKKLSKAKVAQLLQYARNIVSSKEEATI